MESLKLRILETIENNKSNGVVFPISASEISKKLHVHKIVVDEDIQILINNNQIRHISGSKEEDFLVASLSYKGR